MSLNNQAKILNKNQIIAIRGYLRSRRNGLRNETIFLLSVFSGLRAIEIASLSWKHIIKSDGNIDDSISLTNDSSKGKTGGRKIPLQKDLKMNLIELLEKHQKLRSFNRQTSFIVRTERSPFTTSQTIVNMFQSWYNCLGLLGCSSHSGRRTFITETSRKISLVGGSLRDIQMMAGHSSLQTTQLYIEGDSEAQKKVIDLFN
jgi:integrase/recombinase XerD